MQYERLLHASMYTEKLIELEMCPKGMDVPIWKTSTQIAKAWKKTNANCQRHLERGRRRTDIWIGVTLYGISIIIRMAGRWGEWGGGGGVRRGH